MVTSRQEIIRHCSLHTLVSALPSFVLAVLFGWNQPSQILGMLGGTALFLQCAIVLHLRGPVQKMMASPFSARALVWGKGIRMAQVILSIPLFFLGTTSGTPVSSFVLVDMWAGLAATMATESLGYRGMLNYNGGSRIEIRSALELFEQAFLATFIEGWILAAGVALLCLAIWLLLHLFALLSGSRNRTVAPTV